MAEVAGILATNFERILLTPPPTVTVVGGCDIDIRVPASRGNQMPVG